MRAELKGRNGGKETNMHIRKVVSFLELWKTVRKRW